VVHRRLLHLLDQRAADLLHPGNDIGEPPVAPEFGGYDREATDLPRVPDRRAHACPRTQGAAQQIGRAEVQVVGQGGQVVPEGLVAEGAVDVAGVTVALQLDGDHPASLRQPVEEVAEHVDDAHAVLTIAVPGTHRDAGNSSCSSDGMGGEAGSDRVRKRRPPCSTPSPSWTWSATPRWCGSRR
jgi:hypothetical protein